MSNQEQDKQFGEADKPYVDPNSGAAPQPGGAVSGGLPPELAEKLQKEQPAEASEPRDATLDASIEHQAAPQGSQPGNPEGENANEAGTTDEEAGSGNLSQPGDGASPDEDDAPKDSSGSSDKTKKAPVKKR